MIIFVSILDHPFKTSANFGLFEENVELSRIRVAVQKPKRIGAKIVLISLLQNC